MIQYDLCEINKGHYLKVMKCSSSPQKQEKLIGKEKNMFVIIPGKFI